MYSTCHAIFGRNSLDFEGQAVCLRPLERNNEQDARAISGRHFSILIEQNQVLIVDLHSKGTWVNDTQLHPFIPKELSAQQRVSVAHALELNIKTVAADDVLRKIVATNYGELGQVCGGQKSVVVERVNDCSQHYYILVPGFLDLKLGDFMANSHGNLPLLTWGGHLWLFGVYHNRYVCKPLVEGDSFSIANCQVHVHRIKAEDQKV